VSAQSGLAILYGLGGIMLYWVQFAIMDMVRQSFSASIIACAASWCCTQASSVACSCGCGCSKLATS
jgi:hypothetical protein